MRILIACEFSGRVRDAFRARGHDAWSCDLLPSESPGPHYCGPVQHLLNGWMPVTCAADCIDDQCPRCGSDFADCPHPSPTQDGYEYRERVGVLFARPLTSRRWDMIIAHPPCTHTAISGAKHFAAKRADARREYCRRQGWLCTHCKCLLVNPPPHPTKPIDRSLFPPNFFDHGIHLHHDHITDITLGAVHAECNAVLWQHHGR